MTVIQQVCNIIDCRYQSIERKGDQKEINENSHFVSGTLVHMALSLRMQRRFRSSS
jgi:hypothetical protein